MPQFGMDHGSSPAVTKEIAARLPSRRTLILAGLRGSMFILRNCPGWGLGSEQAEGIRQGCRIAGQGVDD
ncbi:MAG: hypothetical protein WB500_14675, partial [Rhodoplanes sp.]